MLDCYFLDISPLLNGGILVNSLTVLPKDRTMNVLSYGSPGDRARSAGSGMLIEYVRNEYGVKGRLKVDRFGKPSFSGGPPFSIARSGSYTIIAVDHEGFIHRRGQRLGVGSCRSTALGGKAAFRQQGAQSGKGILARRRDVPLHVHRGRAVHHKRQRQMEEGGGLPHVDW